MERHALADAKTESIRFRRQTSAKTALLVHSTLTVLLLGVRPAHLAMLGEKKDFQFVLHAEKRLGALLVWEKN